MTRLVAILLALVWAQDVFAADPPPQQPGEAAAGGTGEQVETGPAETILKAVVNKKFGAAVLLCADALKTPGADQALRSLCARAHVGLGDRLLEANSPANARVRWEEAATLDPSLMDDPDFVARLATPTPAARPHTPVAPRPILERPVRKKRPTPVATAEDGPRFGRGFGMGMSFGFDGLMSATLSWLTDQRYLVEVAFGIVYPSADVRFRWLGLKHCVTPYLGAGLFVPFGQDDRLGLDLASYESLYELGESFHLDLGVAWMPYVGLDLSAGIAFVTPFDQEHPDTVLFFPQVSGSVTWRF